MLARDIEDYLVSVARKLGELGGRFIDDVAIVLDNRDNVGKLRCVLEFVNGSRLEVSITAAGPAEFPDWLSYRFHFMDSDETCIVRYDSAPYHPGAYFPHHKHIGPDETPMDHPRPSLAQVIDEVRTHVYG